MKYIFKNPQQAISKRLVLLSVFILVFSSAHKGQDKTLRKLNPDRPGQTESAITLDKGHFGIETDIINLALRKTEYDEHRFLGAGLMNLKFGVARNMDIQLLTQAYAFKQHKIAEDSTVYFPDLTFRVKLNLCGNDSGLAIALMPYIKTNNFLSETFSLQEGGLLLNIFKDFNKTAIGYTGGISLTDIDTDEALEIFSSAAFDYEIHQKLHHFLEAAVRYNLWENDATSSVDTGLTYCPHRDLQLDAGMYYFLKERSPFLFMGATIRF